MIKLIQVYDILMGLYVLDVIGGFIGSVPMLLHVAPSSKCMLFATQIGEELHHGNYIICNTIGYGHIILLAGAIFLFILTYREKTEFKKHIAKIHTEQRVSTKLFTIHAVFTLISFFLGFLTTIGYGVGCNNLSKGVNQDLRNLLSEDPKSTRGEEIQTRFEDNYKFHRYTHQYGNKYGAEYFVIAITCRSLFSDPEINHKLHKSHVKQYGSYMGYFYGIDIGAYKNDAFEVNTLIETSIAGGWIAIAGWLMAIIIVMVQRFQLKKKLVEEDRLSVHSNILGEGSQFRKGDGSTLSGRSSQFQRNCPSRGSDRSIRSTKSIKRDVDDIALSIHRANGLTGSIPLINGSWNSKETGYASGYLGEPSHHNYHHRSDVPDSASKYIYRDEMETEIF